MTFKPPDTSYNSLQLSLGYPVVEHAIPQPRNLRLCRSANYQSESLFLDISDSFVVGFCGNRLTAAPNRIEFPSVKVLIVLLLSQNIS